MNTNKPGSPSSADDAARPGRRFLPWQVILLGGAALALAVLIGTQVIGVLYSILAPPSPPLPEGARLLSHTGFDYGVDDWLYGTDERACTVARFYQEQGGVCRVSVGDCEGDSSMRLGPAPAEPQNVARCVGEVYFSIFAMRWEVTIASGYEKDGQTRFSLSREVFWTGSIPPRPEF